MSIRRRGHVEEPEIIVIPMIDVMMFLLFFFMVASLAMAVQNAIPVQLPKASTGNDHDSQNITITITAQHKVYLNTKETSLNHLQSELKTAGVSAKNLVTINADEKVSHGEVISAMDEARKAGVVTFGFATNRQ